MSADSVPHARDPAMPRGLFSPTLTLAVATGAFAASYWVWTVLASSAVDLTYRFRLDPGTVGLLVAVPLVVGAVGRFPVGTLTDRYGARLMLPIVTATSAGALALAAFVTTAPALVLVALAFGTAGTMFVVGTALVCRCYPHRRRGWALGVFGTGLAGSPVACQVSHSLGHPFEHRTVFVMAACALAVFAVAAALVIRDRPVPVPGLSVRRAALAALRMPAVPRLATLYAAALGPLVAGMVYLPVYLRIQYGMEPSRALALTGGCVATAAVLRVLGGALADREAASWILGGGFGVAGSAALGQAFAPPVPLAAALFTLMAVGLGVASGVLLALVGLVTPPQRTGAVAGVVGAVGAFGALVPPLLLSLVYALDHSFAIGLTILAALLLGAATVRTDGLTSAEREELALLRKENRTLRARLDAEPEPLD